MPQANPQITNFTSGEVSPLMRGRVDTTKYNNGADTITNMIVLPQGGVWRRPGTRYIGEVDDSDKAHRIIPFEFSNEQAYLIELGDSVLRVWKDDALVKGLGTSAIIPDPGGQCYIDNITDDQGGADVGIVTITTDQEHTYETGDTVLIHEVEGTGFYASAINGEWTITDTGAKEFTIDNGSSVTGAYDDSTGETGFTSNGAMRVLSPYAEADLAEVQYAQSADVMYFTHPDYEPYTLKRASANRWEMVPFRAKDGPYEATRADRVRYKIRSITWKGPAPAPAPNDVILIRTTGAHNLSTGDEVEITGADDTDLANGTWVVTVIDDVQITLNGSYSGGGGLQSRLGFVEVKVDFTLSALTDRATIVCTKDLFDENGGGGGGSGAIAANDHIEIYWNGRWVLFKCVSNDSNTQITADLVEHGLYDLDPSVQLKKRITYQSDTTQPPNAVNQDTVVAEDSGVANGLIANFSGVFSRSDRNKYVRITQATNAITSAPPTEGATDANWFLITAVNTNTNGLTRAITSSIADSFFWNALPAGDVATKESFSVANRTLKATLTTSHTMFASTDIGRWVRLKYSGVWVRGEITAYASATSVTVKIDWEFNEVPADPEDPDTLVNNGLADEARMGAWCAANGFPRTVVFHEQRLCFAGSSDEPQTVWMSASSDFQNFQTTEADGSVQDDLAVIFSFASTQVNSITWLQSGPVLLVGTIGGEWQIRSASGIYEPITPSNIAAQQQTSIGSIDDDRAVKVGPGVLFLQRGGRKLYDMTFSYELDAWQSVDATIIAEHILRKGTKGLETAYQREPYSIIWVRLSNGALAGMTFYREQQIAAWHYHTIGGSGVIESIAVIPNTTGTEEVLYMIVRRTIDGNTKRYIEKLDPFHFPSSESDISDQFYVDSGITDVTGVNPLTGLDHLEGETVNVLSEGQVLDQGTVSGGELNLGGTSTKAQVGFAYTHTLLTLPKEGGSPFGSAMGKIRRSPNWGIRTYRTPTLKLGTETSNLQTKALHATSNYLFSGDTDTELTDDYNLDVGLTIESSDPVANVILAIWPQQHVNE